ncbi:MAG: hypothetical protein KKF01_01580, partial [Proteobacteria bacterium]|nr:hypothetical protein [Pseudomonadota bacterium]
MADFFDREIANDLPIWLFIFPPAKSGCEYTENAGQGQKEKAQSIWLLEELQCKRKRHPDQRQTVQPLVIARTLVDLSKDVVEDMQGHQYKARTITIKIRFSDFETFTRAMTISDYTDSEEEIRKAA